MLIKFDELQCTFQTQACILVKAGLVNMLPLCKLMFENSPCNRRAVSSCKYWGVPFGGIHASIKQYLLKRGFLNSAGAKAGKTVQTQNPILKYPSNKLLYRQQYIYTVLNQAKNGKSARKHAFLKSTMEKRVIKQSIYFYHCCYFVIFSLSRRETASSNLCFFYILDSFVLCKNNSNLYFIQWV